MSTYSCETIPSYNNIACNQSEMARVRSIVLVKNGVTIVDPSNEAEWIANAATGDAIIIREIRGNYDGGQTVESAGFGSQVVRVLNMNHTMTVTDPRAIDNIGFWNVMKRQSQNYTVWLLTENYIWNTHGIPSIAPTMPIPEDITQEVNIVTALKWQFQDLPTPYAKPNTYLDVAP
jgi:hypothetical protein